MFECLEQRICFSLFYDFDVIAKTDGSLTSILPTASINDAGQVAFVGVTSEGQSVYVGTGTAAPTNVTFAPASSTRTYGQELQINNAGQVAAVDRTNDSTVGTRARFWDANAPGTFSILARGTTPPSPILPDHFDILSSFTTISNDGNVALSALDTSTFEIHLSKTEVAKGEILSQVVSFESGNFFRFMAADGDRIVVGSRNTSSGSKQITLYDNTGAQTSNTIASVGSDWQDLGVRPGISDDGRIVTFYGDLTSQGANSLTNSNGSLVPIPLRPGPGIFASVKIGTQWVVVRVAGVTGNSEIDPGERLPVGANVEIGPDFDFDGIADWGLDWTNALVDSRPSVTSDQPFNDASRGAFVQVSYLAFDSVHGAAKSLYSSRLNLFKDGQGSIISVGVEAPVQVVRLGEDVSGLGVVTDLAIHDSVNNSNVAAFWAAAGGTQAIVKATPDFSDRVRSRPRFDPDSPLVEYVVAGFAGAATRQDINQIVIHATGGRERSSLLTLTAGATPGIQYLISREGRVTQIIQESSTANHAQPVNASSIGIELIDDYTGANGTGHIDNPNWATNIQQSKAALLVRDITLRRPTILRSHLTTSANVGPFETQVANELGVTPNRNGIGTARAGVIAHGQILNRTAGRTDPQNFPSGALSPATSYTWGGFMTRVNNGIGLQLNSPANLLVTDPTGKRVGVDPTTGLVVNEIPGAVFSGPGTEPQTLTIPEGKDGDYDIKVVGSGSGPFRLDLYSANLNGELFATRVAGQTNSGLVTGYNLKHVSQKGEISKVTGTANLPPIAFGGSFKTDQDTSVVIRILENDSDPDGTLSAANVILTAGPNNGSVNVDQVTGSIQYNPNTGFVGQDSIRYQIRDSSGDLSNEAVLTISVKKFSMTPVAVNDSVSTRPRTPVAIDVKQNDFDNDGTIDQSSVIISHDGEPSRGEVNVDPISGIITYSPFTDFVDGVDSFRYLVRDNDGTVSGEATVTVTILAGNTVPVLALLGDRGIAEQTELTFTATATDADTSDTLTYSLVGAPTGATIDSATGVFRWTPAETDGPGSFALTVRVTDNGSPALTDEETITVTVNEVNQAPVLSSIGNKSVSAGSSLNFNALATDDDLPANTLTYGLVGETNGASINSSTGAFSWTPTNAQGTGNFQFTVRVTDNGTPASFDEEQITVNVQALATPPNAANDVADLPFGIVSTIDVLINDTPVVGGTFQNATLSINSTTLFGTIRVSPDGRTFEYTPESGFFGRDSFTYRVVDSSGATSNIATVTINVAGSSTVFSVSPLGVRTPDLLISAMLATGSGITVVNGSTAYVGTNSQSGLYANLQFNEVSTNTQLRADNGILLTTGTALVAIGNQNYASNPRENNATVSTGTGNDIDLAAIVGSAVADTNSLTFDFTVPSTANSIRFDLIFGTEEFPDFVTAGFNDIMGVFLDGVQIAFDSTGAVFSVDNNFFVLNNSGLQIGPTVGKTAVNFSGFEYDGITSNVTTTAPLNTALTTHKLKFVIADFGDQNLDSAVFLSNLRAVSNTVIQPTTGGSVSGSVIDDADGDGLRDPNENGLSGQTVYIDANGNGIFDVGETNVQTDLSGNYLIESVPPGNIVLRMNLPSGKTQTFPNGPVSIALTPGQDITNLDFGQFAIVAPTGVISGIKFNDLNGNGIRDRGIVSGTEPDVIYIIDVSGSTTEAFGGTAVGDLNGDRRSNTILDAEIAGFIALTKDLVNKGLGQTADVSLVAFSSNASTIDLDPITLGVQPTTKAGADRNSNGILDVEEALRGLSSGGTTNFEAALLRAISIIQNLGTAPENGNVVFLSDGFPDRAGAHTDESTQIKALANNVRAFGVGSGASLPQLQIIDSRAVRFTTTDELLAAFQGVNSGGGSTEVFTEPGLSGVTIFIDTNNNGQLDVNEPRTITRVDDVATTTVDETGTFQFTQLPADTYIVREVVPAGFAQTRPAGPTNSYQIVLTANATSAGNDFGNTVSQATNSVSGYVYADVDNDGIRFVTIGGQQLRQTGLPNVKMQLVNSVSGAVFETLTKADGYYEFLTIPNGTFDLVETQPIIFVDGKDTAGTPSIAVLGGTVAADRFNGLRLTGGVQATEYNFGERGLKAAYVTKSLLLASTPNANALAAQYDTNARFRITASSSGLLTIAGLPGNSTAQLFTLNNQPLPLVATGPALAYSIGEGESVYLVVESQNAGSNTLDVSLQPIEQVIPIRIGANTNSFIKEDADGDGRVTPLDALLIINHLNSQGSGLLTTDGQNFIDVNRDGSLSPLDALIVINRLNRKDNAEGEATSVNSDSAVFAVDEFFGDPVNTNALGSQIKKQRRVNELSRKIR